LLTSLPFWMDDIESVDHFGYLWPQKMPEVAISWQFMATKTAGYWRLMALSQFTLHTLHYIQDYNMGNV
jgi:hypothetical protein